MSEVFQIDLSEDYEDQPVPEGSYVVRVDDVSLTKQGGEKRIDKNGAPWASIRLSIPDEPAASSIFHPIFFPGPNDDSEKSRGKKRGLKRFLRAFGLSESGSMDPAVDWPGATAEVLVKLDHDDEYGDRNVLVLPRIS